MHFSSVKTCRHFILIYFAALPLFVYPQQSIDTLLRQLQLYNNENYQEKLFLHTDKNFYVAGEIMWFKIYNVDASYHLPACISKVAYVEIVDVDKQAVLQAKIELTEGTGDGFFYLPVHLNSGNYKLRAYTNWMKNYPADRFFEKTVTIINTNQAGLRVVQDTINDYDIHFFPEGGNLVNGMESKVAFKVTDRYGKGLMFTGSLINENNDTVAVFRPLRSGIGTFTFTPVKNRIYRAVIRVPGKAPVTGNFVPAADEGYTMSVINKSADELQIRLRCNVDGARAAYFVAHTRQSVKVSMALSLANGEVSFVVDKKKLGDGISHFTVFNAAGQPVSERLWFKQPLNLLEATINTTKEVFSTREQVHVEMETPGSEANLSMAIYRIDSMGKMDEADIASYLLLTSDLKGPVESPSLYLADRTEAGREACDNLMLTHGWRRFAWADVIDNNKPVAAFAPEYAGPIIRARITRQDRTPAKHIVAYLSLPGPGSRFHTATSDGQGYVAFDASRFYGTAEMVLQTHPVKDTLYKLEIENPFAPVSSTTTLPTVAISNKDEGDLTRHHISAQVQQVFGLNRLARTTDMVNDTIPFYVHADFSYNLDAYSRFITMEEVLREYVKFVFVKRRSGNYYLQVYDIHGSKTFENEPLVLVNGIPVFDGNKVLNIDPLKIRKLETVNSRYIYGNSVFEGIVNLTSYDSEPAVVELDQNAVRLNYEGLQVKREFYSPAYDTEIKRSGTIPDFRNLLYWAPALKTNSNQVIQQHFYTSDLPGRYAIVVQGISIDGKPGSAVKYFEVKE
jgi:hypothetical protein